MNPADEPQLAPPGAGLPAAELLIARALFAWRRWRGNGESFTALFRRERDTIRSLVAGCDPSLRGKRVLIERPRGLEDSSRNWSVWMTLDHLRITNLAFARVIHALTSGHVPPGRASTAAVKPDAAVTAAVEAEYEQSCDGVLVAVEAVTEWKTPLRYEHPWFGPLDASGWHALAGTHMRIHRGQLERIIASLT